MSERSLIYDFGVIEQARETRRRVAPLPPDDRRAAIIEATLPLLEECGGSISTRQIASAAGVAEGTLFRVFPDKTSLIHATVLAASDPTETIAALEAIPADVGVRTRVAAVLDVVTDRVTRHQRMFAVAREMVLNQGLSSEFGRALQKNRERVLTAVIKVLEPDAAALRISPHNLARLLMSLVVSARGYMYAEPASLSRDEMVEVLLDGVLKPDATKQPTEESSC